ncbi:hypothetical protein H2201_006049 [Coniosporium apollinis]|uniref:Glucosidase 2 subunit beta n=1 Tax=Coniosporium apollinis TaxID=61459 RepID=A0ABQ9NRK4_9PEZI|nr:hypothetical protein H2201_006049 [Coniosporium apollinis]
MRGKYLEALLLSPAIGAVLAASEPPRPRGVGPEFAKFYKSPDTFTCISAPSIHIPITQLNDDYCDCPDGSDEPGTSACSFLSQLSPPSPADTVTGDLNTSNALPGYYCKNKGHQPAYIPFTYVNDGICDYELCCDGSDEWAGVGGVKCEDRCKEIGREARKLDEARQAALGAAMRRRRELVKEAERMRKEVEDRIETLVAQVQASEIHVADLEREVKEVERRERGKVVKGPGKGGKLVVLAGLARPRIEELRESLLKVRRQRDESVERVKKLEGILSTFQKEYDPNYNDMGVKRAVRSWEEYAANEQSPEADGAHERDLDEILKSDEENGLNWEESEHVEESDVEVLYKFEEYLPKSVRDWVDQKLRDLRETLIENGVLARGSSSDASESKAVTDARNRLKTAQDELRKNREGIDSHKADLEKDYGPDGIFRALKGQCVSQDSGEYTYEFCWMEKTTQKSRKGGAHTGMGNFVRIEKVTVDEDLPADGKGLGSGERWALKFENGQHCWNGPNRSTKVILACGEKDEIWKVVEEEKCVYRMEVGTPAVCGLASDSGTVPTRDEL